MQNPGTNGLESGGKARSGPSRNTCLPRTEARGTRAKTCRWNENMVMIQYSIQPSLGMGPDLIYKEGQNLSTLAASLLAAGSKDVGHD